MSVFKFSKADTLKATQQFDGGVVKLPQYTTAARDALTAASGDFIYNSTTNKLNFYNGSAWEAVTSS